MPNTGQEIDIAKNIRAIEWLKAEAVDGIASLFKSLTKDSEEAVVDALAATIISCYLLSKRLGIGFSRVDECIRHKIATEIESEHQLEEWYGDFTAFLRYAEERAPR